MHTGKPPFTRRDPCASQHVRKLARQLECRHLGEPTYTMQDPPRVQAITLWPLLLTLKNPRNFFFSLSVSSMPREDFLKVSGGRKVLSYFQHQRLNTSS